MDPRVAGAPIGAREDAGAAEESARIEAAAARAAQDAVAAASVKAAADAKAAADRSAAEAKAAADAEAAAKALRDGGAKAALAAAEQARDEARAAQVEAAAQLEAIKGRSAELDKFLSQQRDGARVAYLRSIGATSILSDLDLLALSPAVDVSTLDGKALIDQWREANPAKFRARQAPALPSLAELQAQRGDGPEHPGATAALVHATLAANLRSDKAVS